MRAHELFEDRKLGKVINIARKAYKTLSYPAQEAINLYQRANWETGPLEKAAKERNELFDEIYAAFAPVRREIKNKFGNTIQLHRAEHHKNTYPEDRVLYSWTYDENVADEFAGHQKKGQKKTLSDAEINKAIEQYNRTGYVKVWNYKLLRNKDNPKYFNIYTGRGNFVTDGDNIEEFIRSENNDRIEANQQRINKNTIYSENIDIDKILWVTNDLNSKEFIVMQPPART